MPSDYLGYVPYLRRYARALTGSQRPGDAAVSQLVESLAATMGEPGQAALSRTEFYRAFHRLPGPDLTGADAGMADPFTLRTRQSMLLTAVEGFTIAQAAEILDHPVAQIAADIATARNAVRNLHADILIIEDAPVVAGQIMAIIKELGHDLAGVSPTREAGVALAAKACPELVLADISLSVGTSGIDAAAAILAITDVPVIIYTAFPADLLTGRGNEPTFVLSEPFTTEAVAAMIAQALLLHRTVAERTVAPAILVMDDVTPDPRKHFDTPEALLADPDLSNDEKHGLLADWDSDIDGQLNAESEGMGISDPLSARREARLAEEATRVKSALTQITETKAEDARDTP